jgi:uncharacterized CHY-type Zn-finger protein
MLISECLDDWCLDLMPVDLIEAGPVTVTAVVNQFNFTLLALAIVLGIVVFVLVKFRSPADEGRKWTTMEVRCPKCEQRLYVASDYIGTATCPACKAQFNEFRDSRIMEVRCPKCEQRLNVPSDYTGTATCPACKAQFNEFRDSRIN